ncbi:MAG: methionyl-tRNA formyltransferase [Chloroflexi bacterium]|jgi:methionyl-tRNA formyltransferase|uniref:Methionyl-tRNA formyltransferase n=1 Tax=Candidatus Thermofonsia Clade 3 bacterium TaxID=2364212 RepID=A0A2M8QG47_9CHLR|nr:methionyl-tRNA formyltransferase [Candidatus Roseilinea sp. NK_OTU-006]PJF48795.1 MAG: methionyl-tRNA formyltransferase [Candidatus Thermofonsia Clade 3 bacterium]RMG64813.1 MAG: methionyl-tRNA formyltransferase [Chloroflexota bacterium]
MTRVIFMGTPSFAVPALSALIEANYDIVAVVTQPDAPAGRGRQIQSPPVKALALQHRLQVMQPDSLRPPSVVAELRALAPDVIIVAAFGQILRPEVLALPPHGCLNIHASLLPRWRGASPVSAAIAAGDAVTGVTLMLMEAGLDSGPIIAQRPEPIRPDDTTGSLTERLARLGAALLIETLPAWLAGAIVPQRQDESRVTLAGRLKKEDGRLDWSRSAEALERHVRAMSPWPSAFTTWQGRQMKVLRAAIAAAACAPGLPPGGVSVDRSGVYVRCGDGALRLLEVQMEGKPAMEAAAFARGHPNLAGSTLGQ